MYCVTPVTSGLMPTKTAYTEENGSFIIGAAKATQPKRALYKVAAVQWAKQEKGQARPASHALASMMAGDTYVTMRDHSLPQLEEVKSNLWLPRAAQQGPHESSDVSDGVPVTQQRVRGPPPLWSVEHIRALEGAWGFALGIPPVERNRLLGLRMKAATKDDPYAYGMVKQDTKEFMQGNIDAKELYERFMSVFQFAVVEEPPVPQSTSTQPAAPPPAPPAPTTPAAPSGAQASTAEAAAPSVEGQPGAGSQVQGPGLQGSPQPGQPGGQPIPLYPPPLPEAETWFKELALLIPNVKKKTEMLQQCPQPGMPPHPGYLRAAHAIRAAALAAMAQQGAVPPGAMPPPGAPAQQPPAPGMPPGTLQNMPMPMPMPGQRMPMPPGMPGQPPPVMMGRRPPQAPAEYADDDEGEEDEGGLSPQDDQMDDYEDESGPDTREFRGWERLDRERMARLVEEVLKEQEAKQQDGGDESGSGGDEGAVTGGTGGGGGRARKKAALVPGLAGVHFNSTSSRPARALKGKKSGFQAVKGQAPPGAKNVVVWLRQDLRLHDNPALFEAARYANLHGGTVTLLYVHSPSEDGEDWRHGTSWRPAGAALLWQQQALASFNKDVVARFGPGAEVVMRQGPYLQALQEVASAVGAWHVFCNRRYEPSTAATDELVCDGLAALGFQVQTYNGALLREPWDVKIDMRSWSGHFGTFTPFSKACAKLRVSAPLKEPRKMPVAQESVKTACSSVQDIEGLGMYVPPVAADGSAVDWGRGIREAWDISEAGAIAALDRFLDVGLREYERARQLADASAVSRLSPYLRFGQLSPRLVWQSMQEKQAKTVSKTFYNRLIWRDLAYWQLHHWPEMPTEPIRRPYVDVEWDFSEAGRAKLRAWQQGRTGFPLVDAGMRELWSTGWMQQTLRMVCAAFLVEHCHVPWVDGARWFHDTLVDADLAINSMMWQNAGKSGLDQWDFVLDPTGKSQDPSGAYIRKWVPELAHLPDSYLHKPWTAPEAVLSAAGVVLGDTYPHRIVQEDLKALRSKHLESILEAKSLHVEEWVDPRGYDLVVAPKGSTTHLDGRKVVLFTRSDLREVPGLGSEPEFEAGAESGVLLPVPSVAQDHAVQGSPQGPAVAAA